MARLVILIYHWLVWLGLRSVLEIRRCSGPAEADYNVIGMLRSDRLSFVDCKPRHIYELVSAPGGGAAESAWPAKQARERTARRCGGSSFDQPLTESYRREFY